MAKLVAHRGWSGLAPENTMSAFSKALNHPDIDAIELDVHLSKDGVPVVIHDFTLDRTTSGEGFVSDYTVDELRQLDAGEWFDAQFVNERIPLLEEVLVQAKGKKRVLVELKQKGNWYEGLEQAVVDLIQRNDMCQEVLVISFDHKALQKVKELDKSISIGLVFFGSTMLVGEQVRYAKASYVGMHHEFVTQAIIDEVQGLGIEMGVWTVDEEYSIERLIKMSDHLTITTNHPERFPVRENLMRVGE